MVFPLSRRKAEHAARILQSEFQSVPTVTGCVTVVWYAKEYVRFGLWNGGFVNQNAHFWEIRFSVGQVVYNRLHMGAYAFRYKSSRHPFPLELRRYALYYSA